LLAPQVASAQARSGAEADLQLLESESGQLERRFAALRADLSGGGLTRSPRFIKERYEEATYAFLVDDYERCALIFYSLLDNEDLRTDPRKDEAEWYLAECLLLDGNLVPAQGEYRKIVDRGPSHRFYGESLLKLIELYGRTGDVNQFNNYYNSFVRQSQDGSPTSLRIRYEMGKTLFRQGKLAEAQGILAAFPRGSAYTPQARYFSGVIYVKDGQRAAEQGEQQIADQKFQQAIAVFSEVLTLPTSTDDHRSVMDLTRLAIARLHYELGRLPEAIGAYSAISGDSPYYGDALYELIWANIEQRKFEEALRAVEIFNLAFPGDVREPALKLLGGHVRVRMEQWDQAVARYQDAATEFRELKTTLDRIVGSSGDPMVYFNQLVDGKQFVAAADQTVPDEARLRAREDAKVDRAVRVSGDLYRQQSAVAESGDLLDKLQAALDTQGTDELLQTYRLHRQQIDSAEGAALVIRTRLLELEGRILRASASSTSGVGDEVGRLQAQAGGGAAGQLAASQRLALERLEHWTLQVDAVATRVYHMELVVAEQLAKLTAVEEYLVGARGRGERTREQEAEARVQIEAERKELEGVREALRTLKRRADSRVVTQPLAQAAARGAGERRDSASADLSGLEGQLVALRSRAGAPSDTLGRIDNLRTRLKELGRQAADARLALTNEEAKEVQTIRKELDFQRRVVSDLETESGVLGTHNQQVSGRIGRQAFVDVAFFYEDMLTRADMGVIDVFWYRKEQLSGEKKKLSRERTARLEALEEAFRSLLEEVQ
jgi:tetratricopeptide (TPR) repeat protein